jgi:hypothetical protein
MSGATFRYHLVSPDVKNLENEVKNVSDHVDVFEISATLCRKFIKSVGKDNVKGVFGGKPLLVVHAGGDEVSAEVLAEYLDITNSVSIPVQAVLSCDPAVLKDFNVEVDLTEVTEDDELTQQLSEVKALTEKEALNLSVRANNSVLESYKGCGLDVSVDLSSVTQESVDDVIARGGGVVSTFVFKSENALSPLVESGVEILETVIEEYHSPIVQINEIKGDLDSLQMTYDETAISVIQEKISALEFNPNVTLYFETKLKFIKDYVDYKIKGSAYELAHLDHKITMMSRANDTANLGIKLRTETNDERKSQLLKELDEYERDSTTKFNELQSVVDSIPITDEDRFVAEKSADELLRTYKLLTILYYNCFDEFNVLKTRINRDVFEVQNRLNSIYDRYVVAAASDSYKENVKAARGLVKKVVPAKRQFKAASFLGF